MNMTFNEKELTVIGTAPHVLARGDGRYVQFRSLGTRYLVTGEHTGGAFAIVEHDLAPRSLGAPMHTHEREDEISHVTAGRLGVQIGDEVLEAGPGDTVFKPRGVAHAFWNPGDEPVRFLELITPAGFERYFDELAAGKESPPEVAARYGLEVDFDSVPLLCEEHGLVFPIER